MRPPERVVVIGPGTEATLHALGLSARVSGVSDFCIIAEFDGIPRVGGQISPNLERIAALQPDLVLVQGRFPSLQQWCAGAEVDFESFATDSIATWEQEVRWIGVKFGILAESGRLIEQLRAELGQLRDAEEGSPPRTLLVVSRQTEAASAILAAAPGSFLSELLGAAGGVNVLEPGPQPYRELNEEVLIRADPAVILEFWPDGPPPTDPLEVWRRAFPRLAAVRAGRVHALHHPEALIPGPRMGAIAREIAAALR